MNKNNKRIIIISTIVLVIALILSVVGVSYAFFNLQINGEDTTTKIEISTGDANGIILSGKVENFHITVDADDMAYNNMGYYYATNEDKNYVKNKEDGIKELGTIEIKGALEKPNTCDATIKVELTSSILESIQEGDFTLGLIYGSNETEIDLKNIPSDGTIIEFELDGKTSPSYIQAYLKLNNANRDQSYLASQEINVKVNVEDFMCEASDGIPPLEMLKQTGGEVFAGGGDHTTLVDELYRYVGTYEEVTNNYICLGKTFKDTCQDGENMYRIIGITEDGKLKVIKAKKYGTNQRWFSSSSNSENWGSTEVYTYLNSTFYKSLDKRIQGLIDNYTWKMEYSNSYPWGSAIVTSEGTVTANIGLIYASDYVNAYKDFSLENWLFISHGLNENVEENEWTMSRYGYFGDDDTYRAWTELTDGFMHGSLVDNAFAVRPVFYIKPNITLSGEGTESNPFIIHTK